ncbi:hypothetical protein FLM48_03275 [Shewanella sp. Scap07]|uniref:hypothetical protein n=1 Tax=Shewanella sp. Scap07 TaxID=2589987 RepID=UPI0015B8ECCB|nr:hypothetical protein [Shewanella sp. Scap07]QLE84189.1 hypothetical protein FLM48_03275 [Shewanella sp. Scap07]
MTSPHWFIIVITVVFLMVWFAASMTSPMMFAAPGAMQHKGNIMLVLSVVHSPIVVFSFFWLMQWTFLGMHPGWVLGFLSSVIIIGSYKVGYYELIMPMLKGSL